MSQLTKDSIIAEFKEQEIFTRQDYTFREYVDELLRVQGIVVNQIYGGELPCDIWLKEAISTLESKAKALNLYDEPVVFEGIKALKTVQKEIAISYSGRGAENAVDKYIEWAKREDKTKYRNITLSNDEESAEIDEIIATKNGFLILEVKKGREDVTITEDGRIIFKDGTCHHNISIGDKMDRKRRLLRGTMEAKFREKGINAPVRIWSYLVFATSHNNSIVINDCFKREKYCTKQQLKYKIDDYKSDVSYTDEEYATINEILTELDLQKKPFGYRLDFWEIVDKYASAMEYISKMEDEIEAVKETEVETENVAEVIESTSVIEVVEQVVSNAEEEVVDRTAGRKKRYVFVGRKTDRQKGKVDMFKKSAWLAGIASVIMIGAIGLDYISEKVG